MNLTNINIHHVRNLVEQQLEFTNGINLILGENGSGKSSVLESIHLLGYGRSFRSHHTRPLINFGQSNLVISAEIQSDLGDFYRFGYQKALNGKTSVRLNQEDMTFLEVIKLFPVQIIHPESFDQIYSGAIPRRKILDWGMFHVEPSFGLLWTKYQKILKQRNSALKSAVSHSEICCWDEMLANFGEQLEAVRQTWVSGFLKEILLAIGQLLPSLSQDFSVFYQSGWPAEESLSQALIRSLPRDKHLGATQVGPHRADLVMTYKGLSVEKILSRGQQKLVMMALFMAQARWLKDNTGKKSVLLIDDVISELDNTNIIKLLNFLQTQAQQVLITAVDEKGLDFADKVSDLRRFCIENGEVCGVI